MSAWLAWGVVAVHTAAACPCRCQPSARPAAVARTDPHAPHPAPPPHPPDKHREPGLYSPRPLLPTAYAGQEFEEEEEDWRLLQLMRAQVGSPASTVAGT